MSGSRILLAAMVVLVAMSASASAGWWNHINCVAEGPRVGFEVFWQNDFGPLVDACLANPADTVIATRVSNAVAMAYVELKDLEDAFAITITVNDAARSYSGATPMDANVAQNVFSANMTYFFDGVAVHLGVDDSVLDDVITASNLVKDYHDGLREAKIQAAQTGNNTLVCVQAKQWDTVYDELLTLIVPNPAPYVVRLPDGTPASQPASPQTFGMTGQGAFLPAAILGVNSSDPNADVIVSNYLIAFGTLVACPPTGLVHDIVTRTANALMHLNHGLEGALDKLFKMARKFSDSVVIGGNKLCGGSTIYMWLARTIVPESFLDFIFQQDINYVDICTAIKTAFPSYPAISTTDAIGKGWVVTTYMPLEVVSVNAANGVPLKYAPATQMPQ